MYALTKTPIPLETAKSIIASHFGSRAEILQFAELPDGMYNAAYLVTLTEGQKVVLKAAPPDNVTVLRYEKNIMQTEVEVLRLLRTQTNVPVPEVFAYDTSRNLINNDYFVMTYIPGQVLHNVRQQLSAEDQHDIDFQTGEYLRQVNSITGTKFGYFSQPKFQFSTWRDAFDAMLENVLQDGRDAEVELPIPYDVLYAKLQKYFGVLDEVVQPALVHWDLWDGNIFIDPTAKKITGIIDCERALWGDPLMEVNFGAFGLNPALVNGYGLDMLASSSQKLRRTLYNIYLWLIMIIECTYRQFETNEQENWVRPKLVEDFNKLDEVARL